MNLILTINHNGTITDISNLSDHVNQETQALLVNTSIYSFFSRAQIREVRELFQKAKTGDVQHLSTHITVKNIVYSLKAMALPAHSHSMKGDILCLVQYKNKYRSTMKRLSKNEGNIRTLLKDRPVGLWHYNIEADYVIVTKGIEQISGYSKRRFLADSQLWKTFVHREDFTIFLKAEQDLQTGSSVNIEYRIHGKNGELKYIEERVLATLCPHGKLMFLEGIVTDISEEKKRETSFTYDFPKGRFSEKKTGMASLDVYGLFTTVNEEAQKITGYSEEELLKMNFLDLLPDYEKERASDLFMDMVVKGGEIKNHPIQIIHKSGALVYLNVIGIPLFNGQNIEGLYVVANDITSRIYLKEKLLENRKSFYNICNQLDLAILIGIPDPSSGNCRILEVNRFTCDLLKYEYADLLGMDFNDIVPANSSPFKSLKETGKDFSSVRSIFISSKGKRIPVSLYMHLTSWDGKEIVLFIARLLNQENPVVKKDQNDFGRQLRILMAEMDINTAELAKLTNLTAATISNLRTGKVKKPNIDTATKIANALGVKISYIWPDLKY